MIGLCENHANCWIHKLLDPLCCYYHALPQLSFLYSCIQTTYLKLSVYHALNDHHNGPSINKFRQA